MAEQNIHKDINLLLESSNMFRFRLGIFVAYVFAENRMHFTKYISLAFNVIL